MLQQLSDKHCSGTNKFLEQFLRLAGKRLSKYPAGNDHISPTSGMFESMIFLFPLGYDLVRWRVTLELNAEILQRQNMCLPFDQENSWKSWIFAMKFTPEKLPTNKPRFHRHQFLVEVLEDQVLGTSAASKIMLKMDTKNTRATASPGNKTASFQKKTNIL